MISLGPPSVRNPASGTAALGSHLGSWRRGARRARDAGPSRAAATSLRKAGHPSPIQPLPLAALAKMLHPDSNDRTKPAGGVVRSRTAGLRIGGPTRGDDGMEVGEVAARTRGAVRHAGRELVDRASLVEAIALAAVAGEHLLVVGPPGTAKSEAVRRVTRALGGRTFEYLLGRFTEPSEIFGPIDLRRSTASATSEGIRRRPRSSCPRTSPPTSPPRSASVRSSPWLPRRSP